ncbi:MAG TPA: CotH kinase family protein [Candidatus Hydrogenedentes bacterium]|nr:CotH kinase family protein [Candidatus Hydrogenedentota bacterium]
MYVNGYRLCGMVFIEMAVIFVSSAISAWGQEITPHEPIFSIEHGFYNAPFELTLSLADPSGAIRYTLDGSTPSRDVGITYTVPIPIDRTTVVRAIAYFVSEATSRVVTHTYLFLSDVIQQSPNGEAPGPEWPAQCTGPGQFIDYGMDPNVVNDPRYSDIMDEALLAIPSISMATDLGNLFDPSTGIYMNAWGEGDEWERPASIELIKPDGTPGFQINAGVRIRGGFSRDPSNPKHAFRLFFRSAYGDARLNYPLFDDEGADVFDKVDLRTAQNYSWSLGGDPNCTMLRDVFSRDTQHDMGQPYTRSRFYHLYINGQYWGLYQTQERSEADYAETYFGGATADYDVVKVEAGPYIVVATDGTMDAWNRLWEKATAGFSTDASYYAVQGLTVDGIPDPLLERLVDLDNLIDYMIVIYYGGNLDSPISAFMGNNGPNNFFGIYNRNIPAGFKFFAHDAEHTLFNIYEDRTGPFPGGELQQHFNPQWLFQQLMEHPEFRMRFADRVQRHCLGNGALNTEAAEQRLQARMQEIQLAIVAESARWGDSRTEPPLNRDDHWVPAVDYIANEYLVQRPGVLIDQLRAKAWFPMIDAPNVRVNGIIQQGGVIQPGDIISLESGDAGIYYRLDGGDPRLPVSTSAPGEAVTLLPYEAPRRVFVPTEENGGAALEQGFSGFEVTFITANMDVNNLEDVEYVLDNPAVQTSSTTSVVPFINFRNTGSNAHFLDDTPYPGTTMEVEVDNFVLVALGRIVIPETGPWTFGVNSDDGFRLTLTHGSTIFECSAPYPRGPEDTLAVFNILEPGAYDLNLVHFQGYGGAEIECFAAQGEWPYFDPSSFHLVGDVANGGLSTGNAWGSPAFDDTSWALAAGAVGYETAPGDPVNFSDLIDFALTDMPGTATSCYVRAPFTYDKRELQSLTLRVRYDDAFIAYLNGVEVVRANFSGDPAWNAIADAEVDDANARNFIQYDLTSHQNLLGQQNVLAVHGLNSDIASPDFLLGFELAGTRLPIGEIAPQASLYSQPIIAEGTTHITARALDSAWSPLQDVVLTMGDPAAFVRITEIMYHPETEDDAEFIELVNTGAETISLLNLRFTNGVDFVFPAYDLAAGAYAVVVRDTAIFESIYGSDYPVIGAYTGRLDNAGENLRLEDQQGQVILDFTYDDAWIPETDGGGRSLTLRDPIPIDTGAWNDPASWRCSSVLGGTPGTPDTGTYDCSTSEGEEEGLPAEGMPEEGEGLGEGYTEGLCEGSSEGEGEGENEHHSADQNNDYFINLSELLRVIQFFNSNGFHCDAAGEDGFNPGSGDQTCSHHASDYNPQDWVIGLSELLRLIQFYNSGGYRSCPGSEDGFCAGP